MPVVRSSRDGAVRSCDDHETVHAQRVKTTTYPPEAPESVNNTGSVIQAAAGELRREVDPAVQPPGAWGRYSEEEK